MNAWKVYVISLLCFVCVHMHGSDHRMVPFGRSAQRVSFCAQDGLDDLMALIDAKASLTTPDKHGKKPLQLACERNRPDIVEAILHSQGLVQTFSRSLGGRSLGIEEAVEHAMLAENVPMLQVFTKYYPFVSMSCMQHIASKLPSIEPEQKEQKESENSADEPLLSAIKNHKKDEVFRLIDEGASLTGWYGKEQRTLLYYAVKYYDPAVVGVILSRYYDIGFDEVASGNMQEGLWRCLKYISRSMPLAGSIGIDEATVLAVTMRNCDALQAMSRHVNQVSIEVLFQILSHRKKARARMQATAPNS